MSRNQEHLSALDSTVGDGDHGRSARRRSARHSTGFSSWAQRYPATRP
ncbi:hypothetical protein ACTWQJ_05465 [Streptomyces sp. KR55]